VVFLRVNAKNAVIRQPREFLHVGDDQTQQRIPKIGLGQVDAKVTFRQFPQFLLSDRTRGGIGA
jgi:hypothetical protein